MIENRLELIGTVVKKPIGSISPAGIHHCQFSLEHRSIQSENGMNRHSFVRILVVASGELSQHLTRDLTEGCNVKVIGFLNRHQPRNSTPILALHAQQIEMIN